MNPNNTQNSCSKLTAIIVAAGNGSRFGSDLPKQYNKIHGKTILRHTAEIFVSHRSISQIQIVIADGFQDLYAHAVAGLPKILPPVLGGSTRQESVYNALSKLSLSDNDFILIHDAARPCLSHTSLDEILLSLQKNKAVSLALPVTDTLRKAKDEIFQNIVDRNELYSMQTPQGFHFSVIKSAHEKFKGRNFTDDTALVTEMGIPVSLVLGARDNIKVTLPEDIIIAEKLLSPPLMTPRTGLGFDVHAFGDTAPTIRIGGVDIPHTHKLKGHSDADVLLHAITDALYGVIANGDIGSHFPPSNPDFKDKDSAYFLIDAVNAVQGRGGKITHIDTVIMCEVPKIAPYRQAIQSRVAEIIGLSASRISIKATTTEELGFTGRREGIAAQAIVTVMLPEDA